MIDDMAGERENQTSALWTDASRLLCRGNCGGVGYLRPEVAEVTAAPPLVLGIRLLLAPKSYSEAPSPAQLPDATKIKT